MSLSQELKKLTKRQLEILWRYYFAKESHEAIGKALNCAARTIGYQRVQALKKLKVNIDLYIDGEIIDIPEERNIYTEELPIQENLSEGLNISNHSEISDNLIDLIKNKNQEETQTKEQEELLGMILDSCRYMNGMLSSLLATYRNCDGVINLNFEEFSIKDLVEQSMLLYGIKFSRSQVSEAIRGIRNNYAKYGYEFKSPSCNNT